MWTRRNGKKPFNLLAEGCVNNSASTDYNTNGIPHYVLIDQKGNIIQNNADIPYQLLAKQKNVVDKLLEQLNKTICL